MASKIIYPGSVVVANDFDLSKKLKLSGSTDGRGIKIVATATAGTIIHTAHATSLDEVWLYAFNSSGAPVSLTIEQGGVSAPDDNITLAIPSLVGLVLIVPGLIVTGSVVVRAFAGTTNVIICYGFVNRITL